MKHIVVIGAGISGMTAAAYLRRSGFDVTICEQSGKAGGVFTSWERKGYFFEGSLDWLSGSKPGTASNQFWKETGALDDSVKVYFPDPYHAAVYEDKTIFLYRDIEKTAKELLSMFPEDEKHIRRLLKDVKILSRIKVPVFNIRGVKIEKPQRMKFSEILKILPILLRLLKLNKISRKQYTDRFKNPALKHSFNFIRGHIRAGNMIFVMGMLNSGDGGYTEGGSLAIANRMAKTFTDMDGRLLLNTKVKKVNISNTGASKHAAVTGVTLENGTILEADTVIVTQETIAALDNLFDMPLKDAWLMDIRKKTRSSTCTYVGIGIRAEIHETPVPECQLDQPISFAGEVFTELGFFNNTQFGYAPEGCTVLTTRLRGDTYDFWKKAKESGRYEAEKQALADQIIRLICRRYPQAEGKIEVLDIATPVTYERYAGSYHGSWMSITCAGDKIKFYPGRVKSVNGLYFAGHRLIPPGGLPAALISGRRAAQMVCRKFNVVFKG